MARASIPETPEGPQPARIKGRVLQGFGALRQVLENAGRQDVARHLAAWASVDELLARSPELVPVLLNLAWEQRRDPAFGDLFLAEDGTGLAEAQDQPIAPCGRTFQQIVLSHLYASARLAFEAAEKEWATNEAKRARLQWRKEQKAARRSLMRLLRKPREPDFDPATFRLRAPMRGLYEAMKPYLLRPEQFGMVSAYALLSRAQVEVLGDLLPSFTKSEQIGYLAGLNEGDLYVLRRSARLFAEWKLGVRRPKKTARASPLPDDVPEISAEDEAKLVAEESRVFRELMAKHHHAIEELRVMGANAEKLINLLAPVFGDGIWAILDDKRALANVVNTPEHLMEVLGPFCRYVSPALSEQWLQMNDQEIIKDILKFCRETFREKEFASYLVDPSRLVVWASLPSKFNNNFKYQRDAMKSKLVRNEEDLRTVSAGIFESLRQGKVL
ncbi:hypothetical protein [Pararhodospirillum photometricum]|nr:hypothetical protein [Pararhodospirillum photometricum]